MNTLKQTSPHFVRCIIPNEVKTGGWLTLKKMAKFKLFFFKLTNEIIRYFGSSLGYASAYM